MPGTGSDSIIAGTLRYPPFPRLSKMTNFSTLFVSNTPSPKARGRVALIDSGPNNIIRRDEAFALKP
jgi:hypothetical protein